MEKSKESRPDEAYLFETARKIKSKKEILGLRARGNLQLLDQA